MAKEGINKCLRVLPENTILSTMTLLGCSLSWFLRTEGCWYTSKPPSAYWLGFGWRCIWCFGCRLWSSRIFIHMCSFLSIYVKKGPRTAGMVLRRMLLWMEGSDMFRNNQVYRHTPPPQPQHQRGGGGGGGMKWSKWGSQMLY
ncbi:hypothetical protein HanIR_Chr11g0539861 [Helianthus annuus]|nr:hypothetical protein HanIR_Chr11g0539861 [Helianthus annuus]